MAKKLTTQEILAAARAQAVGGAPEQDEAATTEASDAAGESGGDDKAVAAPEAASPSAGENSGGAGSAAPKSTKDILAAARAQAAGKSGGGEKPSPASSAAKPAAAPKSTSDILAAARAQAGKGQAAATADVSSPQAASKPKQPSVSEPAGERPSVQEMLRAVREGKPAEPEAEAKPKPSRPPVPQKPPVAARPVGKKGGAKQTRRNVLIAIVATPFAFAWTMFAAAAGVFTVGLARFMMPNVLVEPPSKFKVGPPSNYPPGSVSAKWKSQFAVWVVHNEYAGKDIIYALKSVCTHLGCTPNWLEGEQKFKCPCHGSGFYITGVNFEGPAPRPLERYGIHVSPDGMLEIDKSVTFNQEKGQWSETASFVDAATV